MESAWWVWPSWPGARWDEGGMRGARGWGRHECEHGILLSLSLCRNNGMDFKAGMLSKVTHGSYGSTGKVESVARSTYIAF